MHRPLQIIRVALFVVAMHAALQAHAAPDRMLRQTDSRLPLSCKNIARDVIMNSCKGPRARRSIHKLDLQDLEKQSKIDASEVPTEEIHVSQQKRQWGGGFGFGPYSGFGQYPGMGVDVANNYHNTDIETPFFDIQDNRGSQMFQEQYGGGYMPMPYGPPGMYPMRRSADISDKLLGYELSPEELEELHEDIGERLARNSKDMNKKIFMNVAAKCCPNAKLCYENPSLIPCMGY
ncbi:uncharacterized protein LOC143215704 [Lasioglossum baleicum]|uniref:uncharacterized protein LOC143215704 n=1 Tax=Lasioglossum baleicum TaxID=434251 RepID=UPI003FCE7D80